MRINSVANVQFPSFDGSLSRKERAHSTLSRSRHIIRDPVLFLCRMRRLDLVPSAAVVPLESPSRPLTDLSALLQGWCNNVTGRCSSQCRGGTLSAPLNPTTWSSSAEEVTAEGATAFWPLPLHRQGINPWPRPIPKPPTGQRPVTADRSGQRVGALHREIIVHRSTAVKRS